MTRPQLALLVHRLQEPRCFLQILAGPRQVGKTTMARQAGEACGLPFVYASADGPSPPGPEWIDRQWDAATRASRGAGAVLVLDEVQKVPRWSEVVKARWDDDTHHHRPVRVVLLGSAPLLVQRGLTESLAGRFELIRVPHWSYLEMREAFGWDLDRYALFGGYPGAASLVDEPERWAAYVRDALVETTLSRDVLLMSRVDKPALLRQLFDLACAYSGQELSFTKMLGQLQDAGNTTTLAHYLALLSGAGLVSGLQKYAGDVARRRGSSPKLCVLNSALSTSRAGVAPSGLRDDPEAWGRLIESCVGAHLLNTAADRGLSVSWWRDGADEVDFVLHAGAAVVGIEVKSIQSAPPRGLTAFRAHFPGARTLVVGAGSGAIPVAEFLSHPASEWLR
jgi:predicted AAA+ superfamily ATPase